MTEAAAERIDGGLESTADRVVAEIEGAVTTMNEGLAKTRSAKSSSSPVRPIRFSKKSSRAPPG